MKSYDPFSPTGTIISGLLGAFIASLLLLAFAPSANAAAIVNADTDFSYDPFSPVIDYGFDAAMDGNVRSVTVNISGWVGSTISPTVCAGIDSPVDLNSGFNKIVDPGAVTIDRPQPGQSWGLDMQLAGVVVGQGTCACYCTMLEVGTFYVLDGGSVVTGPPGQRVRCLFKSTENNGGGSGGTNRF